MRRIVFEGPVNFRDLGGYPTVDGRRVAWGHVYRSDSLHTVTPADVPTLRELGVRTAIDFRAHDEIEKLGIGPLGEVSVQHVHCPTFDRVLGGGARTVPANVRAADLYLYMLERGAGSYVAAARALAAPGALPAVFFCMAGKDRTGCFAALLLGLLGVDDETIVEDYVLTQEAVETITARRIAREGAAAEAQRWLLVPADLREARAEVMQELLGLVRERWGSWHGYATAVGLDAELVTTLRDALLDDVDAERPDHDSSSSSSPRT